MMPTNLARSQKISVTDHQTNLVETLYASLGQELAGLPSSLLIRTFYKQAQSVREDGASYRAWAEKEASDGKYPKLAAEMLAAARLRDALRFEPNTKKSTLPNEAIAHYLTILKDETLPVTWRGYIAMTLFEFTQERTPLALVYAAADLVAHENEDALIQGGLVEHVLRHLHKSESSPRWKAAALAVTKKWNEHLLRPQGQWARSMQWRSGYRNQEQNLLLPLMAMNLRTNQTQAFQRLSRSYEQQVVDSKAYLALLVQYQRFPEARRVLERQLAANRLGRDASQAICFDESLSRQIPAFLQTITGSGDRYLAECLLVSLAEAPRSRSPQETVPTPDLRLERLADRFAQVSFENVEQKKQAVTFLVKQFSRLHCPRRSDDSRRTSTSGRQPEHR